MTTADRTDPTQARVFADAENQMIASADAGSPTMLRLPIDIARPIAENIEAHATYQEGVAAKCTTDHGREAATRSSMALRAYAAGLRAHATGN